MSASRIVLPVGLLGLCLLAACLAVPVDDGPARDRTASYSVSNAADGTFLVTVSFASTVDGFEVAFSNDSTRRYPDASSLDEVPRSVVSRATRVVPLGDDVQTFSHRLGPGEGVGNTVESLSRGAVTVYTVATLDGAEPMRASGVDTCGSSATESTLDLRISSDGSIDAALTCRD
ncbi:hypothetical protein [Salinigranum sp.]|uniref:hypothetical protein n=1 Tax=Salinigranum sp. TaxID=1966351 RepID=UPI00356B1EDA